MQVWVSTRVRSRCRKFFPIHAGQIVARRHPPPRGPTLITSSVIAMGGKAEKLQTISTSSIGNVNNQIMIVEQWCKSLPRPREVRSRPGVGLGSKPGEDPPGPAAAEPGCVSPSTSTVAGQASQPSSAPRAIASFFPAQPFDRWLPFVTGRGGAPGVSDSLPAVAPATVVAVTAPTTIVAVTPTVVVIVALPTTGLCAH